jgi:hypothetical protein
MTQRMISPFQGLRTGWRNLTQGCALGYYIVPFQGDQNRRCF